MNRYRLHILFLILFTFFALSNSTAQRRLVKVLGISVEGTQFTDANMVRLSSGINVGTEITGEGIQEAIRQLWRLGLFSDIQIVIDRELPTGVFLTIKVAEYPRLDSFEIIGNKELKKMILTRY